MSKKEEKDKRPTNGEIEVEAADIQLLTEVRTELSENQRQLGELTHRFYNSPEVKALREKIDQANAAYQRIGLHVLKKHGIEGADTLNWHFDFPTGKLLKNQTEDKPS